MLNKNISINTKNPRFYKLKVGKGFESKECWH